MTNIVTRGRQQEICMLRDEILFDKPQPYYMIVHDGEVSEEEPLFARGPLVRWYVSVPSYQSRKWVLNGRRQHQHLVIGAFESKEQAMVFRLKHGTEYPLLTRFQMLGTLDQMWLQEQDKIDQSLNRLVTLLKSLHKE